MTAAHHAAFPSLAERNVQKFTFAGQKWFALLIIAGLLLIIILAQYLLRRRRITKRHGAHLSMPEHKERMREDRRGGLVMGADRRLSTSKAIAVLWTIVVAWMLVAIVLIAQTQTDASHALSTVLKTAPDLYLVLLGGPYAAAVLSKVSVNQYIDDGRLKKSEGDGSIAPSDLISDDSGNTSVYDFQYVLFNIIAALAVVSVFSKSVGAAGFPAVPTFLAILTGGSALTYTISKGANVNNGGDQATTQPEISAVTPASGGMGDSVTIFGKNFATPGSSDRPIVQIGDYRVTVVESSDIKIVATLAGLDQRYWPAEPLKTIVFTADGRTVTADSTFVVI